MEIGTATTKRLDLKSPMDQTKAEELGTPEKTWAKLAVKNTIQTIKKIVWRY